jgi:ABC-type Fe3+ transport system permease subunit
VVYGITYLSATIILAAYSAVLVSFIANNQETIPINDMDELLHSGTYKFGVLWNSTELAFFSVILALIINTDKLYFLSYAISI